MSAYVIFDVAHGDLGIDLAAVWLVVEQDLSPLAAALDRMIVGCRGQL